MKDKKFKCPDCESENIAFGRDFFPHIFCRDCMLMQEVEIE